MGLDIFLTTFIAGTILAFWATRGEDDLEGQLTAQLINHENEVHFEKD